MNYLAHAYLSNNDEALLIGNFIADHVRGNELNSYDPSIREGIRLHRNIDSFTDHHPLFQKSKRLFYNGYERYSGVLVDIFFDHFLAKDFDAHSTMALDTFTKHVYEIYNKHLPILPKNSQRFLSYVLENNIYHAYSKEEGIERVLYHLSHRINHGTMLNGSMEHFRTGKEELQENFDSFIADLKKEFIG